MSDRDPAAVSGASRAVSLPALFFTFFRIGLFTFGGGLAMVGVLRHELVRRARWLEEPEFLRIVSLSTAIPGAIAVNIAFLVGRRLCGRRGTAAAILGVVLPSFAVILTLVVLFLEYLEDPRIAAFFRGAAAAVTALIAYSAYLFGKRLLVDPWSLLVTAGALLALFLLELHPVIIIIVSLVIRYLLPDRGR